MSYVVYILECSDGSLYAGATNDLKKRLVEHNAGKRGAKYTRARRPVVLRYSKSFRTLARARAYEAEIKRMKREEKIVLIKIASKNR
ncbi:MAG: endonuclease [Parcubacteria group bacterium]|nr:endonuclease [Parcubacteria group bacterium]